MTLEQIGLFTLFAAILGLLLWGRVRHDMVAAAGLLLAVVLGLVPEQETFSGFSNPAVVVVALVLIASRAFENAGVLNLLTRALLKKERSIQGHIALTAGLGAALSAVINNVAALALLMPLDVQAARRAGRRPGLTLMPLAFGTILGGMITLIGTPPNLIASSLREEYLGEPFQLFDFTPVGLAVAIAGLAFISLIGWRLVPKRADPVPDSLRESFLAEVEVPEGSPALQRLVGDLTEEAEAADVLIVDLVREGRPFRRQARFLQIEKGDRLVVEGASESIASFIKQLKLQEAPRPKEEPAASQKQEKVKAEDAPSVVEVVVTGRSRLSGRSAAGIHLRSVYGVTLLGISRAGRQLTGQLRRHLLEPGDVLLITGVGAARNVILDQLGLIVVDKVSLATAKPFQLALAIGLFLSAILAASFGLISFTVALAIAVAGYAASGLVPAREFYRQIDWSVIVMLASLLPLGAAFDRLGCTALVADLLMVLTSDFDAIVTLGLLMFVVMTLADLLNNVATMVVAGPLAISLAERLGANPDTFLMGVAVATSCAFLSPIGHKNNTLIMGPGGYRFGDYWRMGLPLELLVLAVALPMLTLVWPL